MAQHKDTLPGPVQPGERGAVPSHVAGGHGEGAPRLSGCHSGHRGGNLSAERLRTVLMSAVSMTSAPRRAASIRGHSEPGGQRQAFYSGNRCSW